MTAAPAILLAEVDSPTRMGMRLALTREGLRVAAEARDADSAVEAALRERPDLAVIAADLPGDGLEAVRRITARVPATRTVVLTPRQSGDELLAAVLAGASGYLGKDMSPTRLPHVLHGVLAGEAALPRRHTPHVLEALRGRAVRRATVADRTSRFITDRQWEILDLLAEGRSTAEMARHLGISEVTARRHVSSVLPKLGVTDRAGAVELLRGRSSGMNASRPPDRL